MQSRDHRGSQNKWYQERDFFQVSFKNPQPCLFYSNIYHHFHPHLPSLIEQVLICRGWSRSVSHLIDRAQLSVTTFWTCSTLASLCQRNHSELKKGFRIWKKGTINRSTTWQSVAPKGPLCTPLLSVCKPLDHRATARSRR